uniref:Uncharacterized protein n=1 Tax=Acrobeloides nanus TaxID=290746 RepID=A0A914DFC3_9BILA
MPEDGPPGQEPTQESVEEPFMPPPNINGDLRRQPTSRPLNENNNAKSIDHKEISVNAPGIFIGHVANKHLVDGNHAPISNTNVRDLICSQCGQNNLTDELSDCNKQINVNCAQQTAGNEKSYCFTRQIIIGSGQNAIEKMCVSEQNIIHEFGVEKVIEGCESMGNGRIRYCICSTENCNSLSILEQFAMANHLSGDHTGQSLAEMPSRAISDEFDERKLNPAKNLQITSLTPKIEAPAMAPSDNENNLTPLHCQVCAEDNVKDETSDCMRITVIDCAQQSNSPKTACLTRQTFLSTGNYAVEKRCINEHEAEHFVKNSHSFDHKSLKISPIGTVCGVTEDEGTKFCLCDSDMCNRFGLKEQVQQYEYYFPTQVQTSSMAHTAMAPTSSTKRTSTMPQTTTTETEMDYRERQIDHPHGNSYMAVTSPSKIDREENSDNDFEENMRNSIKERQERWKDSTQNNSCSSIFINSFILVLITMLTMSFLP